MSFYWAGFIQLVLKFVSLNKMEELEEGKSFGTFSDLDNYLKEYENSKFVQLYKRSSHTIEYHQKNLIIRINPDTRNRFGSVILEVSIPGITLRMCSPRSTDTKSRTRSHCLIENSRSACFDSHNSIRTGINHEMLLHILFTHLSVSQV